MRTIIFRNINRSSRRIAAENGLSSIQYESEPILQQTITNIKDISVNKEEMKPKEDNKINKIFEEILKYNLS